jgi:hypothetical protein
MSSNVINTSAGTQEAGREEVHVTCGKIGDNKRCSLRFTGRIAPRRLFSITWLLLAMPFVVVLVVGTMRFALPPRSLAPLALLLLADSHNPPFFALRLRKLS